MVKIQYARNKYKKPEYDLNKEFHNNENPEKASPPQSHGPSRQNKFLDEISTTMEI